MLNQVSVFWQSQLSRESNYYLDPILAGSRSVCSHVGQLNPTRPFHHVEQKGGFVDSLAGRQESMVS